MKSIQLNPDGTFPHRPSKEVYYTATTTTSTDPDFTPDPPRKRTWKELRKEMFGMYVMIALFMGTLQIVVFIIQSIVWLIRFLNS